MGAALGFSGVEGGETGGREAAMAVVAQVEGTIFGARVSVVEAEGLRGAVVAWYGEYVGGGLRPAAPPLDTDPLF